MPCYVNLPLSWVRRDEAWLDWFIAARIAPELGLDPASLGLPRSWHERIAARLRDAAIPCAVHLPFMGIQPASGDPAERANSRSALGLGADLASLYGAAHMIGHPYYQAPRDGASNRDASAAWLDTSVDAWRDIPRRGGAPLFLENTYETAPEPVAAVITALIAATDAASVGVCFDVGHWYSFAGGSLRDNLKDWLAVFALFRTHLHLHDNNGAHDEHLGLGRGGVPLADFFAGLSGRRNLTATMEPHDAEAFIHSADWLMKNPAAAALIGWPGFSADAPAPPGMPGA